MKNHLIMFAGTDCPHCDGMRPLLAKLQFEAGLVVDERDIWKSETDYRMLENYRGSIIAKDPECNGIPFFYNTKTGGFLCGEVGYKELANWAIE